MALRTRTVKTLLAPLALALLTGMAMAGPLTPPGGPVAPTGKTLTEVEPRIAVNATNTPGDATTLFRITQPGSYSLTDNIMGVSGKSGIVIAASDVTLDLNGFRIAGVAGSVRGVSVTSGRNNITIRNGTITAWGVGGLVNDGFGYGGAVEGIHASFNTGDGIQTGNGMVIRHSTAWNNTGIGIKAFSGVTLDTCAAADNGSHGFSVTSGVTISNCTANENAGDGFFSNFGGNVFVNCVARLNDGNGFTINTNSQITNCQASENGSHGIRALGRNLIVGNSCAFNGVQATGAGILVSGSDNRIEGNNCASADRGIQVDAAGNVIIRNTCSTNTTNWIIAANNIFGAIIDRTAPASAAVSGNSAAGSIGSIDPHANISY